MEEETIMPERLERGALTEAVFYILLSVYTPLHGYAIMQKITMLSKGRVTLGAGTLYGAINTLVERGWIVDVTDAGNVRKREYIITDVGKRAVCKEIERLKELLENGENIAGGVSHESC